MEVGHGCGNLRSTFPFFTRHLTSHAISQGPASVRLLLAPRVVQACLPVISQSVCANTFAKVALWVLEESFILFSANVQLWCFFWLWERHLLVVMT